VFFSDKGLRFLLFATFAVLYLYSLTQPAYIVQGGSSSEGWFVLLIGWMGALLDGVGALVAITDVLMGNGNEKPYLVGGGVAWFANPLMFMGAVLLFESLSISMLFSGPAVIFTFSLLVFKYLPVNEAGHYKPITSYEVGYYFWVASSLVLFFGTLLLERFRSVKSKNLDET